VAGLSPPSERPATTATAEAATTVAMAATIPGFFHQLV
jgi:hypothetical protein